MARYTGPVCRLCRREGVKLFLKGERCLSNKCGIERRAFPPGMHGQNRRRKETEYGLQLREKQKARRIYGLLEKQFRSTFDRADRKKGITGEVFLTLLEKRFDNVVYRLGFANSRTSARQLVSHRHFTVNGKRVNLPSYVMKKDDVIEVYEGSKKNGYFENVLDRRAQQSLPSWLSWGEGELKGTVINEPQYEEFGLPVKEQLIVEFYSK